MPTGAPSPRADQDLAAMQEEAVNAAHPDPAVRRALLGAYRAVAAGNEPDMALVWFDLATAYLTAGDKDAAEKLYRRTLAFDPAMAVAHQNLSCILWEQGKKDEARAHRDQAYREQCVFSAAAPEERRRILIPHACGHGNVPLNWLLPRQVNTLLFWFVEYSTPQAILTMPAYDIVFNAVGDADMDGPTFAMTCALIDAVAEPALNDPRRVAETRRDRLPRLLSDIPGAETPPVLRVTSAAQATEALMETGLAYPLLLRPAGAHGGQGLCRIDGPEGLAAIDPAAAEAWYLTPFRDCRSADGQWRKYRMIFVDRRPYPYHLAISSHWMVHYVTADMLSDPGKRAEEQRFLEDPESVLGAAGMAAIQAIGDHMDLEFAGVDFAIQPDGTLLVFEANATMLVHPEDNPDFAYKNPYIQRITDAFEAMLANRRPHPSSEAPSASSKCPVPCSRDPASS